MSQANERLVDLDPNSLKPNPFQVRDSNVAESDIVDSIRKIGLIEYPIVRPSPSGEGYEIAAGHKRVDACRQLGRKVRCLVRTLTDEQMAVVPIEENLRRKSLNPIEEARGYENLKTKFGWSDERIALQFGSTRDVIAQRRRLLTFERGIQQFVAVGALSQSHAEAVARAPANRQLELAGTAVERKLSVADTDRMARDMTELETANQQARDNLSPILREINARLEAQDARMDAQDESIATIRANAAHKVKTQAMFLAVTNDVSQLGGQSPNPSSRMVRRPLYPSLGLDADE